MRRSKAPRGCSQPRRWAPRRCAAVRPASPPSAGDWCEATVPGPFESKVLVGRSIARELQELRNLRWVLAGVGAGIMAVGLVGGWLLSARAIRPIRTITDTARAISASDLSRR